MAGHVVCAPRRGPAYATASGRLADSTLVTVSNTQDQLGRGAAAGVTGHQLPGAIHCGQSRHGSLAKHVPRHGQTHRSSHDAQCRCQSLGAMADSPADQRTHQRVAGEGYDQRTEPSVAMQASLLLCIPYTSPYSSHTSPCSSYTSPYSSRYKPVQLSIRAHTEVSGDHCPRRNDSSVRC